MKKNLTMVLILMTLVLSACSNNSNYIDGDGINTESESGSNQSSAFRNSSWGDSMEQVRKQERDLELFELEEGRLLICDGKLQGYDCSILYNFVDNKFVRGAYHLSDLGNSIGSYKAIYDSLKEKLYVKYGEPIEDTIVNLESQSLIDAVGEQAVRYGYVLHKARWEIDDTEIMIVMSAQDFEISILIYYTDINYDENANTEGL